MNIDITKISSRGQVVIPKDMRNIFREGDKLVIIQNNSQLIFKKTKNIGNNVEEDIEFAKRTEEAWKRYEKGEFITRSREEFLKELEKW